MNYITTTDLRTKSTELIKTLKEGKRISLVHRSRVVGEIRPAYPEETERKTITDVKKFEEAFRKLKPKRLIPRKDRDKVYRKHLMEKYGKGLL